MSVHEHRRPSGFFAKLGLSLLSAALFASAPVLADDLFEPLPAGQAQSPSPQAWPDAASQPSVPSADQPVAAVPANPDPVRVEVKADDAAPAEKPAEDVASHDLFDAVPIYDRQALEKLSAEKSVNSEPHPLMLQYPEDFTVVCEAGCKEEDAEIVYRERKNARGPVTEPGEKVKALPVEQAKNVVQCVGGCYLGERVYGATASAGPASAASEDMSWMGSAKAAAPAAKPVDRKNDTSGRWFDRIGG